MAKKKWLSPAGRKMKSSMIKEYGKKRCSDILCDEK